MSFFLIFELMFLTFFVWKLSIFENDENRLKNEEFSWFATLQLIELVERFRCGADFCPEDACISFSEALQFSDISTRFDTL